VKLLFDQNLSHRLVHKLIDIYPECQHVGAVDLKMANDTTIWEYAKSNGFMIVSKDSDFHQRSFLLGSPPKIVWIRRRNCSTETIEQMLRDHVEDVKQFEADATATFLILS
jgi:predicted nuclease of predicted toxin-antitoxin system